MAATLAVFGPAKKQFGVLKKQPKQAKAKIDVQVEKRHRFVWNGANWQCGDCCTIKRSDVAWSDSQKCRGTSAVSAIEARSNGHVLWAATVLASGSTIIWCRLCGRHAETRVKSLAQVCPRHMSAQAATRIRKINKQMHPVRKNVRLSIPWKYMSKPTSRTDTEKVAGTSSGHAGMTTGERVAQVQSGVLAPNFDDSEAEDFWSDDEFESAYVGAP